MITSRSQAVARIAKQLGVDGVGVVGVVDADIADLHAPAAQPLGEIAHAGEDQGQLLLVVLDVGGFAQDLGHEDDVVRGVETAKRGQVVAELIAQHQSERPRHARPAPLGRRVGGCCNSAW